MSLHRRRFSLLEIYNEIISEIFDFSKIKKYEYRKNNEGWEFDATIEDEIVTIYVYVERTNLQRFTFSPIISKKFGNQSKIYNFGFEIGELKISSQYTKTSFADYIRILATVGEILQEFISMIQPDIITFFSGSKKGGKMADPQKDDIYFKAIDSNIPAGYELESIKDKIDNKYGLMLYQK